MANHDIDIVEYTEQVRLNTSYLLCPYCHHTWPEPRTTDGMFFATDRPITCPACDSRDTIDNNFIQFISIRELNKLDGAITSRSRRSTPRPN